MIEPFDRASPEPESSDAPIAPDEPVPADGFDRDRVLQLLDRLERDIVAVEAAMLHVEAGEHEAFAAAVSTLEPQLLD